MCTCKVTDTNPPSYNIPTLTQFKVLLRDYPNLYDKDKIHKPKNYKQNRGGKRWEKT